MLALLNTIRRRRAALADHFRPDANLAALEESCIPSYCHRNVAAASVAWWRMVKVAALCRRYASSEPASNIGPASEPSSNIGSPSDPILDFGAGSGEIAHLLGSPPSYHFIEADDALASALLHWHPQARRDRLESLPPRYFRTILALDSLEHNEDLAGIIARLSESLRDDGVVIVSGPTESWLYRLGRRIAGFHGHYHKHTVYDVERALAARFSLRRVVGLPPVLPLFRISVWQPHGSRECLTSGANGS